MKSLYSKIICGFLVSVLFSFSISAVLVLRRSISQMNDRMNSQLEEMSLLLIDTIEKNPDNIKNMDVISDSLGINILAYNDNTGYVEYDSFKAKNKDMEENLITFAQSDELKYSNKNNYILTLGFKVSIDDQQYSVFIQKSNTEEFQIFKNAMFLAGGIIFITGSIIFLIIADIIVKPLSRLSSATAELAKGNYHIKVSYEGKDEIGKLSKNVNFLASQLGENEKTRQRFISEISHEFQTPLTSIQGFATILKDESLTAEQRERYSDIILFESKRLSNLSKSMLQLTLLEKDDLKLDIETYAVNEQLIRVVDSLQDSCDEKNIELVLNVPNKDIMIEADENRLEQVWINIINNAIKYTNNDGYISVGLKKGISTFEVTIADTGIGMTEEALHHIFERFYREDKARSVGGNGLGLSIVKSIVDLHHGNIDVESEVDVGSKFIVTLPLRQKKDKNGNDLKNE